MNHHIGIPCPYIPVDAVVDDPSKPYCPTRLQPDRDGNLLNGVVSHLTVVHGFTPEGCALFRKESEKNGLYGTR